MYLFSRELAGCAAVISWNVLADRIRWHLDALLEPARFLRKHDRNAVANRIGKLGGPRNQLLLLGIVFERTLGKRADQNFQKLGVNSARRTVGRYRVHGRVHSFTRSWQAVIPASRPV